MLNSIELNCKQRKEEGGVNAPRDCLKPSTFSACEEIDRIWIHSHVAESGYSEYDNLQGVRRASGTDGRDRDMAL